MTGVLPCGMPSMRISALSGVDWMVIVVAGGAVDELHAFRNEISKHAVNKRKQCVFRL